MVQTQWVASQLRRHHPRLEIELVPMTTRGDRITNVPLAEVGGKGLFITELERALQGQRADLAVHSLKDMPASLADGLELVAVPAREDPRDVLVSAEGLELDDLIAGSRVGTSSLRRTCQLRQLRPDLQYTMLRGNVDTRLQKLNEGQYAAIVLAYAGLIRLRLADRPLWPLPPELSIPAIGQGALALEARADDAQTYALVSPLEDTETRIAVEAERAFLRRLGGDCSVPLAGHARLEHGDMMLRMDVLVGSVSGEAIVRAHASERLQQRGTRVQQARRIGEQLAEQVLARGAKPLLEQALTLAARKRDPRVRPS